MADEIILRKEAQAQSLPRYFTGKSCKRGHVAERFTRNLTCVECDRLKRQAAPWHKANPEKNRERSRQWTAKNPEKRAAYRAENRERLRAEGRARWHAMPLEERRALARAAYQANREERIKYTAEWVKNNPERAKACKEVVSHRRRARLAQSEGTHTQADLRAILAAQGHRCAYCKTNLKRAKRHLDHIMPLALGGSNDRSNLQYLCAPCNLAKGAKHPVDFAQGIGLLL